MTRRDPLVVLARLRAVQLAAARRDTAGAAATLRGAEAAGAAAAARRMAERREAEARDYAAWRPAAAAESDRLARDAARAGTALDASRAELVVARTAARLVGALRDERRAAARQGMLARDQQAMEEAARAVTQVPGGPRPP